MIATVSVLDDSYQVDFEKPLDISIPLRVGLKNVNCFYAPPMQADPVIAGDFKGSTALGGPVNFMNVRLNPHGNGTHTECVGHISKEKYTINNALKQFMFPARLITVFPRKETNGDRLIYKDQIEPLLKNQVTPALLIRTMPNDDLKLTTNYSGANPTFMHHEAVSYIVNAGVKHLLIDLPSVDKEEDGGKLLAHKAFWNYPESPRADCTITELVYVRNEIKDGLYLLNIQIASFELDVSPSKPVLYWLDKIGKQG